MTPAPDDLVANLLEQERERYRRLNIAPGADAEAVAQWAVQVTAQTLAIDPDASADAIARLGVVTLELIRHVSGLEHTLDAWRRVVKTQGAALAALTQWVESIADRLDIDRDDLPPFDLGLPSGGYPD